MKRQVMALMLGIALFGAGNAQAFLIDSFDKTQATIDTNPGSPPPTSNSATDAASILPVPVAGSHTRMNSITAIKGIGSDSDVGLTIASALALNNNAGSQASLTVTYDLIGGADLNGAANDLPWMIFHVSTSDLPLVVTVRIEDGAEFSVNTFVKKPVQHLTTCADTAGNPAGECPEIVGPIFGVSPGGPGSEGNYFHGLGAFLLPGTLDPVTGAPFGTKSAGFTAASFDSVDKLVFTFNSTGDSQDFVLTCLTTGKSPKGTADLGKFSDFVTGDDAESTECVIPSGVPEPTSILLLGTGFLGLGLFGIRTRLIRRRQQA